MLGEDWAGEGGLFLFVGWVHLELVGFACELGSL